MTDNPQTQRQTVPCLVCGEPVAPQPGAGRPRRYCSSRCKSRAERNRRLARDLSADSEPKRAPTTSGDHHLTKARRMSRQAAIELVAADPTALREVLLRAKPMIVTPSHRAASWREVTEIVHALAELTPRD